MCGVEAPNTRGPVKHIRGHPPAGRAVQNSGSYVMVGLFFLFRVFIKTYILCKNML